MRRIRGAGVKQVNGKDVSYTCICITHPVIPQVTKHTPSSRKEENVWHEMINKRLPRLERCFQKNGQVKLCALSVPLYWASLTGGWASAQFFLKIGKLTNLCDASMGTSSVFNSMPMTAPVLSNGIPVVSITMTQRHESRGYG